MERELIVEFEFIYLILASIQYEIVRCRDVCRAILHKKRKESLFVTIWIFFMKGVWVLVDKKRLRW